MFDNVTEVDCVEEGNRIIGMNLMWIRSESSFLRNRQGIVIEDGKQNITGVQSGFEKRRKKNFLNHLMLSKLGVGSLGQT